jgi:predicted Zn-dependent peptidase
MYLDGYVSPEETIAGINRVTVREVMDLANEILAPERLSLALMGPVSPEEL